MANRSARLSNARSNALMEALLPRTRWMAFRSLLQYGENCAVNTVLPVIVCVC